MIIDSRPISKLLECTILKWSPRSTAGAVLVNLVDHSLQFIFQIFSRNIKSSRGIDETGYCPWDSRCQLHNKVSIRIALKWTCRNVRGSSWLSGGPDSQLKICHESSRIFVTNLKTANWLFNYSSRVNFQSIQVTHHPLLDGWPAIHSWDRQPILCQSWSRCYMNIWQSIKMFPSTFI